MKENQENKEKPDKEIFILKSKLELAFKDAGIGIWEWNISANNFSIVSHCPHLSRFGKSDPALKLDEWIDQIHPDDKQKVLLQFQNILDSVKTEISFEHQSLCTDGKYYPVTGSGKVILFDSKNKPQTVVGTIQLFDQTRTIETHLKEISKEFDIFLNLTPSAIFAVDMEQRITRWNIRAEEITGYLAQEVLGKKCNIFADYPCKNKCGLFDPEITKPFFSRECSIKTKTGKTKIVLKNVNVLTNSKGEIIGGVESFEDITYQKEIEKELKQSEINFLTFFNATDDFLFVISPEGMILKANHTVLERLKYTGVEIGEKKIFDLLPVHLKDQAKFYFNEILNGNKRFCSIPFIDSQNSYIPVETTVHKGIWNQQDAIYVVSKDISDLLLSEEKYAKVFDSNSSAMAISTLEGGFINANNAFEQLSGYSKNEIIGRTSEDLKLFINSQERDSMIIQLLKKRKLDNFEISLRSKNNFIRTGLLSLEIFEIQDKEYILSVFNDLTEKISAQAEASNFLEELKRSNSNLEQFAYIASHDLQEPLRKILTFSDRLNQKYSNYLDETGIDYLNRMHSAAERMQKMINDLLAYSRISTKSNPFTEVDLNEVLKDTVSDLELMAEKVQAVYDFQNLPVIEADLAQMRQVFLNFIGNSLKYHKDNIPPIIQVSCELDRDQVIINFSDNGIGFEQKYAETIFQPFHRLHGRGQYEGSGIGLAICKKIIERHKGAISAISSPGNGSSFMITLPLKQVNQRVN